MMFIKRMSAGGGKKTKKYFLMLLLAELVLSYIPAGYAQAQVYDYTKAGVSTQIETYLCAPTKVDSAQRTVATVGNDSNQAAFNNANSGDLYNCINRLYKFAIVIACVVGMFFIVIAGYVYMASEGNAESVEKAKSILTSTIASLVILMTGYVLLKAINPDLIKFQTIQPPSVKQSDLPVVTAEGTGGGNKAVIGTSGTQGCNNCADYSKPPYGLIGNGTQKPGQNTFLNTNLLAQLVRVKGAYQYLIINEGYPPTVDHAAACHFNGTCADIGTTAARTAAEVNKLCKAVTDTGLKVWNEYSFDTEFCGKSRVGPGTTGGHLHIYP